MSQESEDQLDYEQRLKKLADEGPLHTVDNEAGIVDTSDETVEEPEKPDFTAEIRFDSRG
jgi:hypothetical protein